MILQNEEVFVRLKSTDGHGMHNVLKHWQSLIDYINNLATPYTSNSIHGFIPPFAPTSIFIDSDPLLIGPIVNSGPSSTSTLTLANKGKMIHLQQ